jgi:bacterial/archaeal transporter family-2 protein
MYIAFLASALLAGTLLAVQASANLQLTKATGTPYGAATVQLGFAAGLLLALAIATGAVGAIGLTTDVSLWQLLGGLASPLYITSGILLFPRLGALAAVALFVTGQMFASLTLDQLGLLGVADRSLTTGVALGAATVLVGITLIIRSQRAEATYHRARSTSGLSLRDRDATATLAATRSRMRAAVSVGRSGWILLGIVAGAGLPIQGAVNAQLRERIHEPLAVALVSFSVATLTIGAVLAALLYAGATPKPRIDRVTEMPWWGWLGGACAVVYVTATFLLIPEIGAATTVALTVTGQQLASAVIDSHGLFQMPRRPLTAQRLTGLVLLIAGSALVQLT